MKNQKKLELKKKMSEKKKKTTCDLPACSAELAHLSALFYWAPEKSSPETCDLPDVAGG